MGEFVLEQTLSLCDSLESDDHKSARNIISQDELLNQLGKENDTISQSAILDAVATRGVMGLNAYEPERVLKQDPLRFALFAIRITIYLEQIGNKLVAMAQTFSSQRLPEKIFCEDKLLNLMLSRIATAVGMAVESLVEEKERFYGSIREVSQEIEQYCQELRSNFIKASHLERIQFSEILKILADIDEIRSLSVNIAEELVRLATGENIRRSRAEDRPSLAKEKV